MKLEKLWTLCLAGLLAATLPSCGGNDDDDSSAAPDQDGDGWSAPEDCDDSDPAYHPGAAEDDCTDPADYNCDGSVGYADGDSDGHAACEDCDDSDAAIHSDAVETCNDLDDDCDGQIDEAGATGETSWQLDADGDGYGRASPVVTACAAPPSHVANNEDCDDLDPSAYPGAPEVCDEVDNNCDSQVDEGAAAPTTWHPDADGDGFGNAELSTVACAAPFGMLADAGDCDDLDPGSYPGAVEVCDGADNDCNSQVDDGVTSTFYTDLDSDGFGDPASPIAACSLPVGASINDQDCDDGDANNYPGNAEVCDGLDNNCNSTADDGTDPGTVVDCALGQTCIAGSCLLDDGGTCSGDTECVNTCISGTCQAFAGTSGSCDDSFDCTGGHTCTTGTCLLDDGGACGGDSECVNTCIGGTCQAYSGTAGTCDDSFDCTGAHTCTTGSCLLDDCGACSDDSECVNTCIGGSCQAFAGTSGSCDDSFDCTSGHTCNSGSCLLDDNGACSDDAECVNTCIGGSCLSYSGTSGSCDDSADCQTGHTCVSGSCLLDDGGSCSSASECVNDCLSGACGSCIAGSQAFTGAQTAGFVVPQGCEVLQVKMWGAGGGAGGYYCNSAGFGATRAGGAGGFVSGSLTATPGETLEVTVGLGGETHWYSVAADGGGHSSIFRAADPLSIAGGGGGAGGGSHSQSAGAGGVGGGLTGAQGGAGIHAVGGGGGTQTDGGVGTALSGNNDGGYLVGGGTDITGHSGTGGGGSGYYGGGGGGGFNQPGVGHAGSGGGGGSSFVPAGGTTLSGTGRIPASTGDPDYQGSAGFGGLESYACQGNSGSDGLVVISWP